MTTYPGAVWRPIGDLNVGGWRDTTRGIILHTAASEATGADHAHYWATRDVKTSANFYIDRDGTITQFADADRITWATGAANSATISVETQGQGDEPWTPQQLAALRDLCVWASQTYGFPLQLMGSSHPSETGIGWHRLGVPASYAQAAAGISQTGGPLWSPDVGKVCPGDDRIAQIPSLLNPATAPKEEEDTTMTIIQRGNAEAIIVLATGHWTYVHTAEAKTAMIAAGIKCAQVDDQTFAGLTTPALKLGA